MHDIDDLAAVDPLQIDRGDPEVSVPELALDHIERDTLARHLHRMRMAKLMGRKSPTDSSLAGKAAELGSSRWRRPWPPGRGPVDHAEQRTDRQPHPVLQPWSELLPSPIVHAHLAALSTLPVSDQHCSASGLMIRLGQHQRLADPQPCPPQHDDQTAEPQARRSASCLTHHRNDLLHPGRIRWIFASLIARWTTSVKARKRRRRAATTCDIGQRIGGHGLSSFGRNWEATVSRVGNALPKPLCGSVPLRCEQGT